MNRRWDAALILLVVPLMALIVYVFWYPGLDSAYWTDWKDRVFWALTTAPPIMAAIAAMQYLGWRMLRVPLATVTAVVGTVAVWFYAVMAYGSYAGYPLNFVWPATLIPGALLCDAVLVWSRRVGVTAVVGGLCFGWAFYPANSVLIAPFLEPIVRDGRLLTVANLQGLEYTRSSVPEYLRLVDVGGFHSFAGQVGIIASLMTGVLCIATYVAGVGLAKLLIFYPIGRYYRPHDASEARQADR